MELINEYLADGIEKISLSGRLDSAGADQIGLRFAGLTATRPALIVVDLSQVSFLASIGIRMLLSNAKALERRGGRMVLAGLPAIVEEVLKVAGIDALIPLYADVGSACAGLKTAAETQ
jgi:anti-sigma B factor antagonist